MTLLARLRDTSDHYVTGWAQETMREAADEIERLQSLRVHRETVYGDLVVRFRNAHEDKPQQERIDVAIRLLEEIYPRETAAWRDRYSVVEQLGQPKE